MSFFETHITETFPWLFKFWIRYVDDILAIVNEKHVEDALKLLNLQEKSIKFTMDMEKDNMLPYLDLKLIRNNNSISFGIYRKDTNTDSYIKKEGFNPESHKQAIFNSLTFRLVNVPLSTEEYNKIIEIAEKNGYRKQIIDKKIGKFKIQKQLKNTTTLQSEKEESKFHKFTYHPFFIHKFQKIFKKFKITLAPRNNFTLGKLFNKPKDETVDNEPGICKIKCKDCEGCYIGQTS